MDFMRVVRNGANWINEQVDELKQRLPPPPPPPPPVAPVERQVDGVDHAPGTSARSRYLRADDGIDARPRLPVADLRLLDDLRSDRASSLDSEDASDGQVNCLDRAVDMVGAMSPAERRQAELVLLQDTRPGAEGRTGHVVVRQGNQVTDPVSGRRYASTEAFLAENPQYRPAGTLSGDQAQRIFQTPAGSPERTRALDAAGVPAVLRNMQLADATPGYTREQASKDAGTLFEATNGWGTDEDAIWRTLGPRTRDDIEMIRGAYHERYGRDMDNDLRGDMTGAFEGTGNITKLDRMLLGKDPITSRDQAELDFKNFDKLPGPGWPHYATELLRAHPGDRQYQARLIELMNQGGQNSKLHAAVSGVSGLFVTTGAGEMVGSAEDRRTLLDAMRVAREEGTLRDVDLQAHLHRGPGPWGEVVRALGVTPASKPSGGDAAVEGMKNLTGDYEKAKADADHKDEWLAKQLADFGPALTPEQRDRYIKAFREHPDNKGVYDKLEATAARLDQHLKTNAATLEQAAFEDPDGAGAQLHKALNTLAESSHASTALELAARYAAADPKSPMGQVAGRWGDLDQVMQKALPNAAAQLLATEGDPDAAFAKLAASLEPLTKAIGPGAAAFGDIKDGLEAIKLAKNGDFNRLEQLARNWENSNPLKKGLAAAGLVFGAVGAAKAGKEQEYWTLAKNVFGAGEGGAKLTAQVLQAGAIMGEVSKGASFAAKLSPGLGVLANGAAIGMHANQWAKDHNPGYLIAAFGDLVGTAGSIVELTPAAPVGLLISGIGAAITAIGEVSVGLFEKGRLNDDRARYLEAAGIPEPMRKTLMDANHDRVRELVEQLHIPPEDVQRLARELPFLLTMGTHNGLPLDNTMKMLKAYGLDGKAAADLLLTMGDGHAEPAHSTHVVLMNLQREAHFARTPEDFDRVLRNLKATLPEHAGTIDALMRAAGRTP